LKITMVVWVDERKRREIAVEWGPPAHQDGSSPPVASVPQSRKGVRRCREIGVAPPAATFTHIYPS